MKNRQSKSVCGYWHSTISIVLKRTRGWIMTLEHSFAEYLSHMHYRKPAASHVHLFMSTMFHKRKIMQEYVV